MSAKKERKIYTTAYKVKAVLDGYKSGSWRGTAIKNNLPVTTLVHWRDSELGKKVYQEYLAELKAEKSIQPQVITPAVSNEEIEKILSNIRHIKNRTILNIYELINMHAENSKSILKSQMETGKVNVRDALMLNTNKDAISVFLQALEENEEDPQIQKADEAWERIKASFIHAENVQINNTYEKPKKQQG